MKLAGLFQNAPVWVSLLFLGILGLFVIVPVQINSEAIIAFTAVGSAFIAQSFASEMQKRQFLHESKNKKFEYFHSLRSKYYTSTIESYQKLEVALKSIESSVENARFEEALSEFQTKVSLLSIFASEDLVSSLKKIELEAMKVMTDALEPAHRYRQSKSLIDNNIDLKTNMEEARIAHLDFVNVMKGGFEEILKNYAMIITCMRQEILRDLC